MPTNYIREGTLKYTPDFIIRHRSAKEAYLVEIKPRGFDDKDYLETHRQIADNYIRERNYDWQFKFVFQDEIVPSREQWERFYQIIKGRKKLNHRLDLLQLDSRYNKHEPRYFHRVPRSANPKAKVNFVCRGEVRELISNQQSR